MHLQMEPSRKHSPVLCITLLAALVLLSSTTTQAQTTYSFTNTVVGLHDTWDTGNDWATALTRTVDVVGVPTSGMVLRQINLDLGSNAGSNISTLAARLSDTQGNVLDVFNAGYFYNTDFSRYVNIKLRDHAALNRLDDYTLSYLGMPYSFGYYRVETPGSYGSVNTTNAVNGTWTFSLIENTGVEIQFNAVELVFGPPFNVLDITMGNGNDACSGSQCIQSGNSNVLLATNVAYPQSQTNLPALSLNGCNWNAEANNTAWFHFIASDPTVEVSVSGLNNSIQQTLVVRNDGTCDIPSYTMIGCPLDMYVNNCNTTTGDPLLYHRVCYDGGTKFNHGYTLTGLVVGQEYALVVDGLSGSDSEFYVEVASGADNGCSAADIPVIVDVITTGTGCNGDDGSITIIATGTDLQYSIDDGTTFQTGNMFTGLTAGSYMVMVMDSSGTAVSTVVTLLPAEVPVIDDILVVHPGCGASDGSITITATGTDLEYSIDGGATFLNTPVFNDLMEGEYVVVVRNSAGCEVSTTVQLTAGTVVIDTVDVSPESCVGNCDGSVQVTVTGEVVFSINGGATQDNGFFDDLCPGSYTVLAVDSNGCTAAVDVVVDGGAVVIAGFTADPTEVLEPGTTVALINSSQGAESYLWDFDGSFTSQEENPLYQFPENTESVTICLTATSIQGCTDTYCMDLEFTGAGELVVPNIFTPNGDGNNDTFAVQGNTNGITQFLLEVYNRYGQVLFSADRVGMAWDGRQLAGQVVTEGTYFYALTYTRNGVEEVRTGHLTLLR